MKKLIFLLAFAILSTGLISGCESSEAKDQKAQKISDGFHFDKLQELAIEYQNEADLLQKIFDKYQVVADIFSQSSNKEDQLIADENQKEADRFQKVADKKQLIADKLNHSYNQIPKFE